MGNEYRDVYGVKGFMPHPMSLVEIENKTEEGKGGHHPFLISSTPHNSYVELLSPDVGLHLGCFGGDKT